MPQRLEAVIVYAGFGNRPSWPLFRAQINLTLHASTDWNMRLSVAGAAKDAQVQNEILLSDFTRNLVVVGR